jgi:hypothetical protein
VVDVKRQRLKPISDKRLGEQQQRREVVEAAGRRDGWRCRARALVDSRCSGPLDPHEVIPRSAWKAGYLNVDNVVMVCRAHHDWIGDHPDEAHTVGLHGYSWERPDRRAHHEG